MPSNPVSLGIIGSGWRSQFFARIALACPERFTVTGWVARKEEVRRELAALYGLPMFASLEEMLDKASMVYAVNSVSQASTREVLNACADAGMPVLSETGIASPGKPDLDRLVGIYNDLTAREARIQFAEQYNYQPHHAARIAFVETGALGPISQAQICATHTVHSASIFRRLLGLHFEPATVHGLSFVSDIVGGRQRAGYPPTETVKPSRQTILIYTFGDRLAVVDTIPEIYNTEWIRGHRTLVRGVRGEIINNDVVYVSDYPEIVRHSFVRHQTGRNGDLEGNFLKGIQLGERWVYRNPFIPAALTDEEIAIATCMAKMTDYVREGREFYPLAEACQDGYLAIIGQLAIQEGRPGVTEPQPWHASS